MFFAESQLKMEAIDVHVRWQKDGTTNIVALEDLVLRRNCRLRPGVTVKMKWGRKWWRGRILGIIYGNEQERERKEVDEEEAEEEEEDDEEEAGEEEEEEEENLMDTEDTDDDLDIPLATYGMFLIEGSD